MECLTDYYRTGELIVTGADLKILLDELRSVQVPEHWLYQSWFEDSDREKWLAHIQSVQQALKEHI